MKETKEERKELTVVKDYDLVNAGYSITTRASILINYLISKIDSIKQDDIESFELSYADILGIVNFDGIRRIASKSEVVKIMNELNRNPIYWQEVKNGEVVSDNWISWIDSLKHDRKKNTFTFVITKALHEFLLKLGGKDPITGESRGFIKYKWLLTSTFRCDYSLRVYEEIVKRIGGKSSILFEIGVDDIRFKCGLINFDGAKKEVKYERYYDLKRYVIEPAIKEINESRFTLYNVSWWPHKKEGKSVKTLKLKVEKKSGAAKLPMALIENLYYQVEQQTSTWKKKLTANTINRALKEGITPEQILEAIKTTNENIHNGTLIETSEASYFKGVLKNISEAPKSSEKIDEKLVHEILGKVEDWEDINQKSIETLLHKYNKERIFAAYSQTVEDVKTKNIKSRGKYFYNLVHNAPTLFDQRLAEEKKTAKKKQAEQQKAQEKELMADQVAAKEKEISEAKAAILASIEKDYPGIWEEAFDAVKRKRGRSSIYHGKTDAELKRSKSFQAYMNSHVESLYTDQFAPVKEKLEDLKVLKERLSRM